MTSWLAHMRHVLMAAGLTVIIAGAGRQVVCWGRVRFIGRLEASLWSLLVGLGATSYVILLLGAVGRLTTSSIVCLVLVWTGLAAPTVVRAAASLWRRPVRVPWLAAPVLILLLLLIPALLAPPTASDWDSLQYHLAFPKVFLQTQRVAPLPFSSHSYFPFTMEMVYTLGLATGGAVTAKCFHFLAALASAGLMVLLGRLCAAPAAGWVAAVLFVSTPAVANEMTTGYIDLGLTMYVLAAVYAWLRWRRDGDARWLALAALACGWAMGIKYLGGVTFLFLVGATLLRADCPSLRERMSSVLTLSLVAGALASPWYLRNWALTGNPVFPFLFELFGGRGWSQQLADIYSREQATYGAGGGWLAWLTTPWQLTMWPWNATWNTHVRYEVLPVIGSAIGPGYLCLAPLLLRRLPPPVRFIVAAVVAHAAAWMALMQYARYLIPTLALLAVALGWAADAAWRQCRDLRPAIGIALASCFLLGAGVSAQGAADCWGVLVGKETPDQYLARTLDMYPMSQFINRRLPEDAVIGTYGEPRGFYLDRRYLWLDPHHHLLIDYDGVRTVADLDQQLRRLGVTHLLVHLTHFHLHRPDSPLSKLVRKAIETHRWTPVVQIGKLVLIELRPPPDSPEKGRSAVP